MIDIDTSFEFSRTSSPSKTKSISKEKNSMTISRVFKKKKVKNEDKNNNIRLINHKEADTSISSPQSAAPPPFINPEDNSVYNIFFRNLRIMNLLRLNYMDQIRQGKLNIKNQVIIVKNFNPYFAMGFLKPNMKVHYYINQFFQFKEPFKIDVQNTKQYSHLIKAFTAKSFLIKKLVRFGHDIYPKHLNITANTLPNFQISYNKEVTLQQLLATYSKVPIIIIDCSDQEGIFSVRPDKKNIIIRI